MNGRRFSFVLVILTSLSLTLAAQERPGDENMTSRLSPETRLVPRAPTTLFAPEKSPGNAQLIVYFVVLAALVGAGLYFLKRGLPLRGLRAGENRLQLLETKMLGNRQFLVVVQYEDNKMLIGVGPGQIQYLCPLDSADADMADLMRKTNQNTGPELL